jgi:beta-1,2-mannosidase
MRIASSRVLLVLIQEEPMLFLWRLEVLVFIPLKLKRMSLGLSLLVATLPMMGQENPVMGAFTRPVSSPVIMPDPKSTFDDPLTHGSVHWESTSTFNPAAIVREGKIYVLYRAEDDSGEMKIGGHTSRLGLASTEDGIHFVRRGEPVFYAADDDQKGREWPGGVEDPRIVEREDGTYVLTYTQWNQKSTDIGIATSKDLIHWTKFGPLFADGKGPAHPSYKSGGIVTQLAGGRLIAARIQGKYWMYWGEIEVHLATSPDLIHWEAVKDAHGDPVTVLKRRPGLFDSGFPEVGPPPVLTAKGIVMLYNGKNDMGDAAAAGLGQGAYSVGQAIFSADDPSRLLERTKTPFLRPEMPFEKSGQYAAGTTFGEGLVFYKGRWFLYYGCADSLVGVVVTGAGG